MANYQKGAAYERELLKILNKQGFEAVRVAGSGKSRFEQPDLLASNSVHVFAIECKYSSADYKTVSAEQANSLIEFSLNFRCTPLLAFRFPNCEWKFLELNKPVSENVSVKKTDNLKNLSDLLKKPENPKIF
jgi:Holliday junction resolvase